MIVVQPSYRVFGPLIPSTHWISTLGGGAGDGGVGIVTDSVGNIYATGYTVGLADDIIVVKYNEFGVVQWQVGIAGASHDNGVGIDVDGTDNIYVSAGTRSIGSGVSSILVLKYNSEGVLQWQRTLGIDVGNDFCRGISVTNAGAVYVSGDSTNVGTGDLSIVLAKYDTNGSIQWQRVLGGVQRDTSGDVIADEAGNSFIIGTTGSAGAGQNDVVVAKYNSSGTIQWQRLLGWGETDGGQGIALDATGNVYITGYTSSKLIVAKYNGSGTIQWQRTLADVSGNVGGNSIVLDSLGDIYITGFVSSTPDLIIVKYDTNGTLLWQRVLGGTSTDTGQGIAIDPSGNVCVTGYTLGTGAGGADIFVARLPSDGSKTGSYGPFVYQEISLTPATSTLTPATFTLTPALYSIPN